MDNLRVCINAVLPSAMMMAVGYLTKQVGLLREEDLSKFNRVVFHVFMPVMVFFNLYQSDLQSAIRPRLLLFCLLGILAEYLLSLLLATRCIKHKADQGVVIQGLYRSNFAIIGLPIAISLIQGADFGAVSVLLAIVIPTYNILAVITLGVFNGKIQPPAQIALNILKNPLILGSLCGILALLVKLRLPEPLFNTVKSMSQVASPMMLFLVGAFFRFGGLRRQTGLLLGTTAGRLIVLPGLILAVAACLGFRGVEFAGIIGVFASGNAIASYMMAEQMEGNAELAANIVVLTNAFCPLTLFAWSLLYKTIGVV